MVSTVGAPVALRRSSFFALLLMNRPELWEASLCRASPVLSYTEEISHITATVVD